MHDIIIELLTSMCSLVLYINTIDFYLFMLSPAALLNLRVLGNFLETFGGIFHVDSDMSYKNKDTLFLSSQSGFWSRVILALYNNGKCSLLWMELCRIDVNSSLNVW